VDAKAKSRSRSGLLHARRRLRRNSS